MRATLYELLQYTSVLLAVYKFLLGLSYRSEYSEYLFYRNAQSYEVHVVRDNEQEVLWRRLERAHDSREHAVAVAEEARADFVREHAPEREEGGHKERGVRKPRDIFVKSRRLHYPLILHSIRNYVHMDMCTYSHSNFKLRI